MELDGELMSKWAAWLAGGMVVLGDDRPESGCLYSRSVEGSRDKTRCSTLCWEITDAWVEIAIKRRMKTDKCDHTPQFPGNPQSSNPDMSVPDDSNEEKTFTTLISAQ